MTTERIDARAFHAMSCGVSIVSAKHGEALAGCIVNTVLQVTAQPAQVSVTINKENFTTGVILESGRFEAALLAETAPMELIGRFGFHTSADTDKFADTPHAFDDGGTPYVTECAVAHIGAHVVGKLDVGTHFIIVGEVDSAEILSNEEPMTYAYYHQVKGGKTPPKASSYDPTADEAAQVAESGAVPQAVKGEALPQPTGNETAPRYGWRCMICGYVIEMDELPDDFTCPMCGMGRDMFERIEL